MTNHTILDTGEPSTEDGSLLSVDTAKEALLSPIPDVQPSIEQIRNNILSNITEQPTVTDVKQALLEGRTLEKQQRIQQKLFDEDTKDISLDGIPFAFLSESDKQRALAQRQQEQLLAQQAQERAQRVAISDENVDTVTGFVGNVALEGVAGAARVVGETVTFGSTVMNALDNRGMTNEDIALYESVKRKQLAGEDLTPEETEFTRATGPARIRESKFSRLENVARRQEFIDDIDQRVQSVTALVNDKDTISALKKLNKNSEEVVKNFEEGEVVTGMGTFLKGFKNLALQDTGAALQLTAQSLPQMYVLAKNAMLGVSTLSAAGYDDAVREFVKEYGRQPDQSEKAIAGSLALVSAGLDAVGAKAVIGGKELLKSITGLGVKTAKATVEAAEKAVATGLKEQTKAAVKASLGLTKKVVTSRVPRAAVTESTTEGVQNILSQLAGKQDLSKIDIADALTEATIGGVSGATIAVAITTGKGITSIPAGVQKEAKKLADEFEKQRKERGIGETVEVLKQAESTTDPELALKAVSEDFAEADTATRQEQLSTVSKIIKASEKKITGTKEEVAAAKEKIIQYNEELTRLAQAHNRLEAGGTIQDALKILTPAKGTEAASDVIQKAAVETVVDTTISTSDASLKLVDDVLGSAPFDPKTGVATPEQVATVQAYRDLLIETETLETTVDTSKSEGKSAAAVNKEVLLGSEKTGFIGIRQHIKNMQVAIAQGDKVAARDVVRKLAEFQAAQELKLKEGFFDKKAKVQKPHSTLVAGFIGQEIKALKAAVEFTKKIGIAEFGLKEQDIKVEKPTTTPEPVDAVPAPPKTTEAKPTPEVKAEVAPSAVPKPEATPKAEAPGKIDLLDPEYKEILSITEKVNITEEIVVEGETFILTKPLNKELRRVDQKINNLAIVFKKCGNKK